MNTTIECVLAARARVGEGPVWDAAAGCLYWVDIKRPAIHRYEPGRGQTGFWILPEAVGCVTPAADGTLLFAAQSGFAKLDVSNGTLTHLLDPEPHCPQNRFNDGKVDRAGRFWAGTVYEHEVREAGSLYRLEADLTARMIMSGLTCPNGIGWSPDNRTLYFTDTMIRTIWAYEFDLASGELGERRVFAQLPSQDGLPDGLTVDAEGYVWSAVWDGWRVTRYSSNGTIDQEIRLPVQRPTSCMFGGATLDTLYITSASVGAEDAPLAGGLFAIRTGVSGIPETPFGGGRRLR